MFIAKVYGNNPKVIESNYLLSVNAQSSAPVIDLTQQKLFKNIAENYNQIQKSCLNAVYPLQVNAHFLLKPYYIRPSAVHIIQFHHVFGFPLEIFKNKGEDTYGKYIQEFNISKKQARDCIVFLESLGLIKRHFRTIQSPIGPLANVMFIELVPECLKAITYPDSYKETSKNDDSSIQDDIGGSTNSYAPAYDNKDTYTNSTPDITTNTSSQNTTLSNDQKTPSVVDEAKDLFRNLNLPDKDIISIVRVSGNNLDRCKTALEVFNQQTTRINNIAGWLIKAVENNYQLQHKSPEAKKNSFNNFEQRQYNFDDIEQKLLCRPL